MAKKKRKQKKRSYQKTLLIIAGAIILSIILFTTFYNKSTNNKTVYSKPTQINKIVISPTTAYYPSPYISQTPETINIEKLNMDDWRTYKDNIYGYSLKYPQSWTMSEVKYAPQNSKNAHFFTLKGKEGNIIVQVGNGFGGGCNPEYHKYLTLFNSQHEICNSIDKKNEEYWSQIYETFGEDTMSISAFAYSPFDKNSPTVLSILSSFER
ncbi:MAG: hypothetical protein KBC00_04265 [Candidatus Levybacteria bacterium]|nr:hypothetical protein [Candidatus Levybacteria bacterium]